MIRGVYTALVTPFENSGAIDLPAFRRLLKKQVMAKVSGVIPCGTTGETPTLTQDEKKLLIETALEECKGTGVQVFAGSGTNNTIESVNLSSWASEMGVDGLLVVTPYYNKPNPVGMRAHFRAISEAVKCKIMLYYVPARTGSFLSVEMMAELARLPNICAIKEASGNLSFTSDLIDSLIQLKLENGKEVDVLSGDDSAFAALFCVGATGVVSVASNLIAAEMVEMQNAMEKGQIAELRKLHLRFFPLFRDLFLETNPVPIKYALSLLRQMSPTVRLPLGMMEEKKAEILRRTLERTGVMSS